LVVETVPSAFLTSRFLRPTPDSNNPNKLSSILLDGLEADHTLYSRGDSTYECGANPLGDAMIDFHFQYYWYAIIFLVFDIAFMFLAFGGLLSINAQPNAPDTIELAVSGLVTVSLFLALMSLGVWYAFRKRGRIYI
jgi:NADH:ubiquinone oxidoreductase subunit 3 (subunit A)